MTGGLAGRRVLVLRSDRPDRVMIDALRAAGAEALEARVLAIAPPTDVAALDAAVADLADGRYRWVGFTSINAVTAVHDRATVHGLDLGAALRRVGTSVAAVGPATEQALVAAGVEVRLTPRTGGSAAALAAIWPPPEAPARVLLPRSDLAAATLPDALGVAGYDVHLVVAYRTVARSLSSVVVGDLGAGRFDALVCTASSTVRSLAGLEVAGDTVVAAIGAPTADALRRRGLAVGVEAAEPTAGAIVEGLARIFATRSEQVSR